MKAKQNQSHKGHQVFVDNQPTPQHVRNVLKDVNQGLCKMRICHLPIGVSITVLSFFVLSP